MKNHGENNQKVNQTISQTPALGPKHDKIRKMGFKYHVEEHVERFQSIPLF
jgi:hypothetical protein